MHTNDPRLRHAIRVKCRNEVFPDSAGYLFSRSGMQGLAHSDRPDPEGWFFYPYGDDSPLPLGQYTSSIEDTWDSIGETGFWRSNTHCWVGVPVALAEVEYLDPGLSNEVEQPKLPRARRGRRRGRPHRMRMKKVAYEAE